MKHLSQFSIWEMIISHQENKFIKTKSFPVFHLYRKDSSAVSSKVEGWKILYSSLWVIKYFEISALMF